jgi:hypothetical protein
VPLAARTTKSQVAYDPVVDANHKHSIAEQHQYGSHINRNPRASELTQIKCYPGRDLGGAENISLPHGKMLPETGGNEVEKYQSRRAVGEVEKALPGAWF